MKLYGFDISNYFMVIKQVAMETDLPLEYVITPPNKKESFLPISPMGKVPALETEHGYLSETRAILGYIGDTLGENALFPQTSWDKARSEELISITDLYIESRARRLLAELKFKAPRNEVANKEVRGEVEKGMVALGRRVSLSPYLLGEHYTVADIYVFYCLNLARDLMQMAYQWDILDDVDGLKAWFELMAAKDTTRRVLADHRAAVKEMLG